MQCERELVTGKSRTDLVLELSDLVLRTSQLLLLILLLLSLFRFRLRRLVATTVILLRVVPIPAGVAHAGSASWSLARAAYAPGGACKQYNTEIVSDRYTSCGGRM